jgi:multidrug efflux pump subunit AcrB
MHVGTVAAGRIGLAILRRLEPFDVKLHYAARHPLSAEIEAELGLTYHATAQEMVLSSSALTQQQLYDYGANFISTRLSTIPGISVPQPYGGKVRTVMTDLDPDALYGKGLSPTDISNALNLQNLILPTGTVKVGAREYLIRLNSSPALVSAMNNMPIKTVNGAPVYMRDVAQVRVAIRCRPTLFASTAALRRC